VSTVVNVWSLILIKPVVFRFCVSLVKIHRMTAFVAFEASHFLAVDAHSGVCELLCLSKSCTKIKLSNGIVYTVVRLLLSHGTWIHNGVNGNAAIGGRGERNRKRLRRSTGIGY